MQEDESTRRAWQGICLGFRLNATWMYNDSGVDVKGAKVWDTHRLTIWVL